MVIKKAKTIYRAHQARFAILFFVLGFLYDVVMLKKIDSRFTIIKQGLFILTGFAVLAFRFAEDYQPGVIPKRLQKIWGLRNYAFQFVAGNLLSAYTVFFFRSGSLASSFVFLGLLLMLLVANEFVATERFELRMRATILSLCLCCFWIYLVPILIGTVGSLTFLMSLSVAWASFFILHRLIKKNLRIPALALQKNLRLPFLGVLATLTLLYFFRVIPPLPLSLETIGIFHQVQAGKGQNKQQLEMSFYRPWWKFWQVGDSDYVREPGESVYCFFSVFSPVRFADHIYVRWAQKLSVAGGSRRWQTTDRIPIAITGGRDEGFRGYTFKTNYSDGDWRISVETEDERELGRIYFKVSTNLSTDKNGDSNALKVLVK